jgi:hypothetical protein
MAAHETMHLEQTSAWRRVQGMGPVEPGQINGLGFMLSDKKPGTFRLEVESVGVLRADQ